MRSIPIVALLLGVAVTATALAADLVEVPGSKMQFPAAIEATVDGNKVKMALTGTAVRRRFFVNVYALASYVQEGVKVKDADDLAGLGSLKRLELVMERDVGGKDMAEAFEGAIRANYPAPALDEELKMLVGLLQKETLRKDDRVLLTAVPKVGLHIQVVNKSDFTIKNGQIARAVWDIYLGKNNVSEVVKKGLVSRVTAP